MHYRRWCAHGDPLYVPERLRTDPIERFWSKVDKEGSIHTTDLGPCWMWQAYIAPDGYGRFTFPFIKSPQLAHRVAFFFTYGFVPSAPLELDHLCRTHACVNPDHLEPVTHQENNRRGVYSALVIENAAKTHCPQGHPYVEGNLVLSDLRRGRRSCLTCRRSRRRDAQIKMRAK